MHYNEAGLVSGTQGWFNVLKAMIRTHHIHRIEEEKHAVFSIGEKNNGVKSNTYLGFRGKKHSASYK